MTNDPTAEGSALLDAAFAASLAGEPPLRLDLDALEHIASRRLRRRRTVTVSGVAAAVATLTLGATLGAPRMADLLRPAAPAPVPGCTTVLRTTDPAYLSWKYGTDTAQWPTYGDPGNGAAQATSAATSAAATAGTASTTTSSAPAWFTPAKSASMVQALKDALPADAALDRLTHDGKDSDPLPYAASTPASGVDFGSAGWPVGGAAVLRVGTLTGQFSISSQYWNPGVPPCTEDLVLRYTGPDGTVVDVYGGSSPQYGSYLGADAFHPDGTWVNVSLQPLEPGPNAGPLPLTPQQLAEIAAAPGLSITG